MTVNKRKIWNIIPASIPQVNRSCSKCGEKSRFQSSNKFRVNANGSLIDVWLIYRCVKCKTVWNMTIYERMNAASILKVEYEGFMGNCLELAEHYGTDAELFTRNKAELMMADMEYAVEVTETERDCEAENEEEIEFLIPSFMAIRVDSLLAKQMEVSRSYIKKCCKEVLIYEGGYKDKSKNIEKSKVRTGMVICIRNGWSKCIADFHKE